MVAGYIALTNGGQDVLAVQQGALSDIPSTDQANWRSVAMSYPPVDNATQIRTSPVFTVSPDGATVSMSFNVEDLPSPWAAMNLAAYATSRSKAMASGGLALPSGAWLETTDAAASLLVNALFAIQQGWTAAPVTSQAATGMFVDYSFDELQAAGKAITAFWQANLAARKACIDGIRAGKIVTSAQVDAALGV
jgi:hypothetical protein